MGVRKVRVKAYLLMDILVEHLMIKREGGSVLKVRSKYNSTIEYQSIDIT